MGTTGRKGSAKEGVSGGRTHSIKVSVGLVEAGVLLTHPKGLCYKKDVSQIQWLTNDY